MDLLGGTSGRSRIGWFAAPFWGLLLGWVAWGPERAPAAAILAPLIASMVPRVSGAWLFGMGYHAAVLRWLPDYAAQWFDSQWLGWTTTALCVAVASLPWLVARRLGRRWLAAAPVLGLVPPFAFAFAGNPIVGWGSITPGFGWIGIILSIWATSLAIDLVAARGRKQGVTAVVLLFVGLCAVGHQANEADPSDREAGHVITVNTSFGPPPTGDLQVLDRIEKVGRIVRSAARDPAMRGATLVFPETSLGRVDSTFDTPIREAIWRPATNAGLAVVIGAEADSAVGRINGAIVLNPSGDRFWIAQRQPAALSMWRPWSAQDFSADWSRDNYLYLGTGIAGRLTICYEQFLPVLFLQDEWRGGHQLAVVLTNSWAAKPGSVAPAIQRAHTQGMASLFGRRLVIAENR